MILMTKKVVILSTGGTISTLKDKEKGGLINELSGEDLISGIDFRLKVEVENFAKITSVYIKPPMIYDLAERVRQLQQEDDVEGIVVTNGTSTMEEVSYFLDMIVSGEKPVVITGAQRSGSDPWPDGPGNIAAAVRVASYIQSRGKGVMVVFSNSIHQGKEIHKAHTWSLDPFDSRDKGRLGYVYPDKVVYYRNSQRSPLKLNEYIDYPVEIVMFYSGADAKMIEFLVSRKVRGIVIEAVGPGNVNDEFYNEIVKARAAGIEVVITTHCYGGRVMPCLLYTS